jgi:hypothetical protein
MFSAVEIWNVVCLLMTYWNVVCWLMTLECGLLVNDTRMWSSGSDIMEHALMVNDTLEYGLLVNDTIECGFLVNDTL